LGWAAHTRGAYYPAIQQFLTWCERAGYQHLEDIEPITVAAYIETLQRQASAAYGQTAHGRHPDDVFLAH
jgi:site-specific recombinase XerD